VSAAATGLIRSVAAATGGSAIRAAVELTVLGPVAVLVGVDLGQNSTAATVAAATSTTDSKMTTTLRPGARIAPTYVSLVCRSPGCGRP